MEPFSKYVQVKCILLINAFLFNSSLICARVNGSVVSSVDIWISGTLICYCLRVTWMKKPAGPSVWCLRCDKKKLNCPEESKILDFQVSCSTTKNFTIWLSKMSVWFIEKYNGCVLIRKHLNVLWKCDGICISFSQVCVRHNWLQKRQRSE